MARTNLDDIWNDLKGNPALLVVVLIAVGAVFYYIYKKNNAGSTDTTSTQQIPQQSPFLLITNEITPPQQLVQGPAGPQGPQGPPGQPGQPSPPINQLVGKTRSKTSQDNNTSGVPVFNSAGGTVGRYYPFNSSVTVIGTTTTVKGTDYYPIQGGGFIKERDLIGFG